MSAELAANLEFVKNHFEGRQGIYIEHGALNRPGFSGDSVH